METWPAHAAGQGTTCMTVALTKDKQLRVTDEETQGKPQMVPKPKFLEHLEGFLKKELKVLGVAEVNPSELRLQVCMYIALQIVLVRVRMEKYLTILPPLLYFQAHREVFEYLIEDFKTYRPLLSAIKNEYEMMLAYQNEVIRQLEPLKVSQFIQECVVTIKHRWKKITLFYKYIYFVF